MSPKTNGLYVSIGPKEDREVLRFFRDGTVLAGFTEDPLPKVLEWLVPTPLEVTKRRRVPNLLPQVVTSEDGDIAFRIPVNDRGDEIISYRGRVQSQRLEFLIESFNGHRAKVPFEFIAEAEIAHPKQRAATSIKRATAKKAPKKRAK